MPPTSIRDVLSSSAFNQPGIRRSLTAAMIVEAANRSLRGYLPGRLSHDIVAISFKNGILRLGVKNGAARHELQRIEGELLEKLRQEFPKTTLSKIQAFISKESQRYEFS